MTLNLTEDETRALVAHLRQAIEYDPFPPTPHHGWTRHRCKPLKFSLIEA
jgi:hypothetical protein